MLAKKACTSTLQMWNHKGRADTIRPQPVMEVSVKKTKLDDNVKSSREPGVKCILYEARNKITTKRNSEMVLKEKLKKINPTMALAQINTSSTGSTEYVETRFGKSPRGSYASYQLSFTESNFQVVCNINSVPRTVPNEEMIANQEFPQFPLHNNMQVFDCLSDNESEEKLLKHLCAEKDKLNEIEQKTKAQSRSDDWKQEKQFRITASNFGLVMKRKRNHDSLADTLLNPKPFTSRYTDHGNKYEPVALLQYEKFMYSTRRPVKVFKSGLVICLELPILGASPDGKVIDSGCTEQYGLVEVKCPMLALTQVFFKKKSMKTLHLRGIIIIMTKFKVS